VSTAPRPEGHNAQLVLAWPIAPDYGRAAFAVSEAHAAALRIIDGWPQWPGPCAVISGPPASGKSHLLHIWAARASAVVLPGPNINPDQVLALAQGVRAAVDDADQAAAHAEGAHALFHLINRAQQEGGFVLLSGASPPRRWDTPLADLRTRLGAATAADIEPPDDALLAAILAKLFADRQLTASPALISFLISRMERSYAAAATLVAAIDTATLGTGKTLSFELADRLIESWSRD
jgi:chromosomal replication initiation ATPase DnaA